MAPRETFASDSPSADSRHQVPDAASEEHFPDLDEGHATGRGPKLVMAGLFLAWATMAVLAVTVLRPELPGVKHAAERAPAIAGQPASPAPFAVPAGLGAKHATPSPSSPPAQGQAQPSRTVKPAATPAPGAGRPAARPSSTPQPTVPVPPAPTAVPTPRSSGGSTYPGLQRSVSICSQAGSASSIGSIIKGIQACASGLASP
jgi:hypothetical protein